MKAEAIPNQEFNLKEETPPIELLIQLMESGQYRPKQFFNTSGLVYRELNMKDNIDNLTVSEMAQLLHKHGMMIKRPFITDGTKVTLGFKEDVIREAWIVND